MTIENRKPWKDTVKNTFLNTVISFIAIVLAVFVQGSFFYYGYITGFFVIPAINLFLFWLCKKTIEFNFSNTKMTEKGIKRLKDWCLFFKKFFLWAFVGTLIIAIFTTFVWLNEEYVIVKRSVWNEFYSK